MAKTIERYVLKKVTESGRGAGPKIPAWYVYDNELKRSVSSTSTIKEYAQQLCDTYNKIYIDKEFEKEVLDACRNL